MLAFTFPGQGSQRPGMGSSWVDHPSWELVEYASETTGRDVASLLLEADQETLTDTSNAQLATFVMSLVVLDAAERVGIEPAAAAGHSLGEYTALVATGALSFEDGVRLVTERGNAMREAAENAPGTMYAVLGLGDEDVEAACLRAEGDVWVANYNAPGQVVISGTKEALERAGEIAKSLGAKRVMPFPVGGAFHTPLMGQARDRLRKALAEVSFRESDPVVIANVDARRHSDPADWPGLLSTQLCAPVRWRQTVESLYADGARTFVELGPGSVLTGLAKRILSADGITTHSISEPSHLEALVEALAGAAAKAAPSPYSDPAAHFERPERLLVSPAAGPFRSVPELAHAAPKLSGLTDDEEEEPTEKTHISVGDLIGWAGKTEIRSAFAGSLEGLLVLTGERVMSGQPVAWLRADVMNEQMGK